MRASRIRVGIVIAVALAVSVAAFAAPRGGNTTAGSGYGLKHIAKRSPYLGDQAPVQMPRPIGDPLQGQFTLSGPVESSPQILDGTSAITAIRTGGSSMYTQKEQADQEIGKLIRRLD